MLTIEEKMRKEAIEVARAVAHIEEGLRVYRRLVHGTAGLARYLQEHLTFPL